MQTAKCETKDKSLLDLKMCEVDLKDNYFDKFAVKLVLHFFQGSPVLMYLHIRICLF